MSFWDEKLGYVGDREGFKRKFSREEGILTFEESNKITFKK